MLQDGIGVTSFTLEGPGTKRKSWGLADTGGRGGRSATSRDSVSYSPRDNVIFELGLFMGALSRSRTFILMPRNGEVKIPTDLLGLTCLQFEPSPAKPEDAIGKAVSDLVGIIAKRGPK